MAAQADRFDRQAFGQRIRLVRRQRELTLRDVSRETGLSVSLLSLIERGGGNPSVGTLVAIANTLSVSLTDLVAAAAGSGAGPVARSEVQNVYGGQEGVSRRVLIKDPGVGIEIAENSFEPGAMSVPVPHRHHGWEGGVLLDGELDVDLDATVFRLCPGDAMSFASTRPHRFVNPGRQRARTIWVNVYR